MSENKNEVVLEELNHKIITLNKDKETGDIAVGD